MAERSWLAWSRNSRITRHQALATLINFAFEHRADVNVILRIFRCAGIPAIKLAAGFLVWGQLCVINEMHSAGSFINLPALR